METTMRSSYCKGELILSGDSLFSYAMTCSLNWVLSNLRGRGPVIWMQHLVCHRGSLIDRNQLSTNTHRSHCGALRLIVKKVSKVVEDFMEKTSSVNLKVLLFLIYKFGHFSF